MFNTQKQKLKNSPLFKDSFWALLGSVLGKGLSLLAGIIVARFLGKELYGQYGLIKTALFNIAVFSTLGLGYTGTRYIAKSYSDNKGGIRQIIRIIYKITLIASGVVALCVLVYAKPIAVFLKAPEMDNALRLTSIIIVFNAINTTQIGILSGFKEFKEIAKNNTFSGIITFLSSWILVYFWDFSGALIALFISMLFNAIINLLSINKVLKTIPQRSSELVTTTKEILSFSIPIALQESMYTIVYLASSYLMIYYGGYGEMGILSAASQWGAVMLFIPGVMKNVMLSYFSSSESTTSLRKKMLLINGSCTLIPWFFVLVLSKFIASFYGESFVNLNLVLIISCAHSVFASLSSVIVYEFVSHGKNWQMFFLRLCRDGLTLLLSWWCLANIKTVQASILSSGSTTFFAFVFMLVLLFLSKGLDNSNQKQNNDNYVFHK
ncbi:MAG: oligosaccharide flippase family protein [Bacteroidales bacterium]|nr:oligosaccharide flippase family protein [Bacteroidales bacterium]